MKISGTGLSALQEIVKCALYYSSGKNYTDIGELLGISNQKATTYINEAKDEGIIKIEVSPTPEIYAAEKIMEKYGIRHVYVFPTYVAEENLEMLAKCSAAYLEKRLDNDVGGISLFCTKMNYETGLNARNIPAGLRQDFKNNKIQLSGNVEVTDKTNDKPPTWLISDNGREYIIRKAYKDLTIIYRKIKRVVFGPGKTMLAIAKAISDVKRPDIRVGSTVIATLRERITASNMLIGILGGKWECELYRFDHQIPADQMKDYADVLIFEAERLDTAGHTSLALQYETGISLSMLGQDFSERRSKGGAGFVNYQIIHKSGELLGWDNEFYDIVFKDESLEKDGFLKLEDIREMAESKEKLVICITTGENNIKAMKAALLGKYFNVLITDKQTIQAILSE